MFGRQKSKNRLVNRSSTESNGERIGRSRKKANSLTREFDIIFTKINNVREWTRSLIRDSIALVSAENDMDIKSYLYDSEKRHLGKTTLENFGTDMIRAAKSSGFKGGIYEKALLKVGECEKRLGTYTRDFVVDVCSSFIMPLKYFMEVDLNKLLEEKEMLVSRKIDYDYHFGQASNSRADKNAQHKLKMAEMALEFQYAHAKEILRGLEVSECHVGHLSDLVSVQSVYHQKCLTELEKIRIELKRLGNNASDEKTCGDSPIGPPSKLSCAKLKRKGEESSPPEIRALRSDKMENLLDIPGDYKTVDPEISPERFQSSDRIKLEKSRIDRDVNDGCEEGNRKYPGVSNSHSEHDRKCESQISNKHGMKCPQKARSSIIPFPKSKPTKREENTGKLGFKPIAQVCSNHLSSSVHSSFTASQKPPFSPTSHNYSGDRSRGCSPEKGYSSDNSNSSKETHVIPIPVRSDYRRDVGKMFFTPCKDMEGI